MKRVFSLLLSTILLLSSCAAAPVRTRAHLFNNVTYSVLKISHPMADGQTYTCTGFIADAAKGLGITAKHCVRDDDTGELYESVFVNDTIEARVLRTSDFLAVIQLPIMMGPPLELRKDKPDRGEEVLGIGYGFGKLMMVVRHVANPDHHFEDADESFVELDSSLVPGMSGGPIVDLEGRVVAVSERNSPFYLLSFGSCMDDVRKLLKGK